MYTIIRKPYYVVISRTYYFFQDHTHSVAVPSFLMLFADGLAVGVVVVHRNVELVLGRL